jgi:hypothetical protein
MKATLFFAFITSVIPVFLLLTYVFSTRHRLAALRERCRTAADPVRAAVDYEAARKAFPASVVARLFGFRPPDTASRGSASSRG